MYIYRKTKEEHCLTCPLVNILCLPRNSTTNVTGERWSGAVHSAVVLNTMTLLRTEERPLLTFRVRPQQVTHGPVVGHFLLPVDGSNLVQGLNGRRQAAVHAEDLEEHKTKAVNKDLFG